MYPLISALRAEVPFPLRNSLYPRWPKSQRRRRRGTVKSISVADALSIPPACTIRSYVPTYESGDTPQCHPNFPFKISVSPDWPVSPESPHRRAAQGTGRIRAQSEAFCDTGKRVPGHAARLSSLWMVYQSFVWIARTSGVTRSAPESA